MIKNYIKNIFIKLKNNNVNMHMSCRISISSVFEGYNNINKNSTFDGYLGYGSYISEDCNILKTKVGRYCSIGRGVISATGNHPSSIFVSTYPGFFSIRHYNKPCYVQKQKYEEYEYLDTGKRYCIIIENDVWIGSNSVILGGVTIGNGAIIAAGAVVTKDVEPYSIVGGVPAKLIKKRFSDEQIEKLLKIKWWDKPQDWLKKHGDKFENIDDFLKEEF